MKNSRKLSFFLLWVATVSVHAEIVTDGTLGSVQSLSGQMTIPQSLGTIAGNNLFHSFQTFNINTGESATFTGSDILHNVISRVTGGQVSNIDGLLKSEIPHANFYFINPTGVTFGVNAQVDVPAAFHLSTANSLKFADGGQLSATGTTTSSLSISEPTNFGFLANQAGDIHLQGSSLSFANKKAVSLTSSGHMSFDNAVLLNPSGAITINAKESLMLTNNSSIGSSTDSANQGGDITVTATKLIINNSDIHSDATANSQGNAGVVRITGDSLTVLNGGKISSQTFSVGNAGDVVVNANQILVDGQGINDTSINSNAENGSSGNAGVVTIKSDLLDIRNGGFISSSSFGLGNGGDVHVSVNSLNIDGYNLDFSVLTGIFSRAELGSNGQAGDVLISATENITLHNHGKISTSSVSKSAGNVEVSAPVILIDNSRISSTAKIDSTGETGRLTVSAGKELAVTNQSSISIQNNATVTDLTGIKEGLMIISAPEMDLTNSSISAGSTGNVNASDIVINFAHALTMDSSFITTSANLGNGGTITINGGGLINLQNSGFLTSVTGADGNGGNINVKANTLIMNNAVIQANAVGGSGGDITLHLKSLIPSESLLIKGGSQVIWLPFALGLNVIQAASANGVNGEINVSSPKFNISGSLIGLETQALSPALEHNPCLSATAYSSSLIRAGKGGFPAHETAQVFVPPIAAHNALKKTAETVMPADTERLPGKALPCAAL